MRNIVILNSLHFSYPLPILMRVSYNTLIVKQNTSDYYKYRYFWREGEEESWEIVSLRLRLSACEIKVEHADNQWHYGKLRGELKDALIVCDGEHEAG